MFDDAPGNPKNFEEKDVRESSHMSMEELRTELSALDDGISELTKRRTLILKELNQRQLYYAEAVQHSHEWYYNLTRSDEAMPDSMVTEAPSHGKYVR